MFLQSPSATASRQRPASVLLSILCLLWCVSVSCSAVAQNPTPEDLHSVRQHTRPGKMRFSKPGVQGWQTVELQNPSDESVDVMTGGFFDGAPLNRCVRRVSIPAKSTRQVTIPVTPSASDDGTIWWNPMLYSADDPSGALLRATTDYMIDRESMQQPYEDVGIVITDRQLTQNETQERSFVEFSVASRLNLDLTRRLTVMNADDLPVDPGGLDVIDHIFLSSSEIADDPARLAVLREWVQQGGRLWVFLNRVGQDTTRQLFGDRMSLTTVDRQPLTDFQLHDTRPDFSDPDPQAFDYPVDFVRVHVNPQAVEMIHTVNGWPASFILTAGRGRVAFTTLGPEAWISPRTRTSKGPQRNSLFVCNQTLSAILDQWHRQIASAPLSPADFEPLLSAQVGYQIPGRTSILMILITFCSVLTAMGWKMGRSSPPESNGPSADSSDTWFQGRRLEYMAVIGPVLALVAAVPIAVLGYSSRSDIPASLNIAEFVQASPGASALRSTGTVAVFSPETAQVDLQGSDGRLLLPSEERLAGTLHERTWADFNRTAWNNLHINTGLQFLETRQMRLLQDSIRATVSFGPDGVTGRLDAGPYSEPQDSLIVGPTSGVLSVDTDRDMEFTVGLEDSLPHNVYMPDAVLTDLQVRRRNLYRRLLTPKSDSRYPDTPVLLAWMQTNGVDLSSPEDFRRTHESLLAVPIEYERTPPETDVVIPSAFLTLTQVRSDTGGQSTVYDNRTRTWQAGQQAGETVLRLELPASVKPARLTEVRMEVRLLAPNRRIAFSAGPRDRMVPVAELTSPAGTYQFELSEPDQIQVDSNGDYYLAVEVQSSTPDGTRNLANQEWKIDYLRLEVDARTIDPVKMSRTIRESGNE